MKPAALGLIVLGFGMRWYANETSYVAEDGQLVEAFWMIPVGYIAVLVGLILGAVAFLRSL